MNYKAVRQGSTLRGAALMAALVPAFAAAQQAASADTSTSSNAWRYSLSVYGYLPSLSGQSSANTPGGGPTIDIDAGKIVDSLKFTFMGAAEANNGRWGAFTDLIYLDLGGSKQSSRAFTIGHAPPPFGATADLSWDLKGSLWTVGGEYRVMADPVLTLDLLAGARMFALQPTLRWNVLGDAGSLQPVGRVGSASTSETVWDGIVGVKGRYSVGNNGKWSLPFYFDAGTGQSHLTYQAAAGVSYSYSWGELTAMWRYLSYDMKPGGSIDNLHFNGPMVGATVRW